MELKDGWNDGGSDFAVGALGPNPLPLGIQVTVQRANWESKIKSDARRAKAELGIQDLIYMTSRRIAQADFVDVAEELWGTDGIRVRSIDSQAIASFLFAEAASAIVLRALGISQAARRPDPVERPDLNEDAAYAFIFFGSASSKFRRSVVEQSILSYLTRDDSDRSREATITTVAAALHLVGDQIDQVSSSIDRLQQDGRLSMQSGELSVSQALVEGFATMRVLRENQWRALGRTVDDYLTSSAGLAGRQLEIASAAVLESAGALIMGAASAAGDAIGFSEEAGPLRIRLRRRMRALAASLTAARVSERDLDRHLRELARLVSNSDIGRILMAGELFVAMTSLETREFERAFGSPGGLELVLDASVAIPLLAGLMFEPAEPRFSASSLRIYELAQARGIPVVLPRVYLEEAASHLLQAFDRYRPLVGRDEDLRFSTNAFVAHYADLSRRGAIMMGFRGYVDSMGFVPRQKTFTARRDQAMARMLPHFRRYGIEIRDFEPNDGATLQLAQEAVTFTAHERRLHRSGRLLEHDARTIAYLMSYEATDDMARIFCTWDQLHLSLRSAEGRAHWQALDPAMLRDVLILTRSGPDADAELFATIDLAVELSEEEGERGAAVLDALVRFEGEGFHDAELLRLATEFKMAYMQALRDDAAPDDLATAWTAWKGGSRELLRQERLPV